MSRTPRRVRPRESVSHRHRAERNAAIGALMAHLFATRISSATIAVVNINVITLEGKPRVMGTARPVTSAHVPYADRHARLQYRLDKVDKRLPYSRPAAAYLNLDEVIRIIRRRGRAKPVSEAASSSRRSRPKRFSNQAAHLAKLEEIRSATEQKKLARRKKSSRASQVESQAQGTHRDGDRSRRGKITARPGARKSSKRGRRGHRRSQLIANERGDIVLSKGGFGFGKGPR